MEWTADKKINNLSLINYYSQLHAQLFSLIKLINEQKSKEIDMINTLDTLTRTLIKTANIDMNYRSNYTSEFEKNKEYFCKFAKHVKELASIFLDLLTEFLMHVDNIFKHDEANKELKNESKQILVSIHDRMGVFVSNIEYQFKRDCCPCPSESTTEQQPKMLVPNDIMTGFNQLAKRR